MDLTKLAGIGIIFMLLISWLKEKILWVLVIILALFIIRWIADVWWWGRDNNRW
jgi:hypothetical protein